MRGNGRGPPVVLCTVNDLRTKVQYTWIQSGGLYSYTHIVILEVQYATSKINVLERFSPNANTTPSLRGDSLAELYTDLWWVPQTWTSSWDLGSCPWCNAGLSRMSCSWGFLCPRLQLSEHCYPESRQSLEFSVMVARASETSSHTTYLQCSLQQAHTTVGKLP